MSGEPDTPRTDNGTPTSDELREQVERSRDELGRTIEALAGKADLKAQAGRKTAQVADRIHETAAHTAELVKHATPEPVLDRADQVVTAARSHRKPLLVAGCAALVVFLLVRRGCRHR
ncbi:DUF3618 domain-containing protein [Streptomyces yangpuensis]|uniref:DUF3618 domain-containing protein n=1 Tax=Streptomyces yangpuensis TaxID=1648182 RepID=A0ABY5PPZ4_9ACTN|nr:DUF3618 domain-containing protein [Streptomyces yangpuensis]UUY45853.1 DUF3618 domain-containing protein [Streptomyces yangpuensis]